MAAQNCPKTLKTLSEKAISELNINGISKLSITQTWISFSAAKALSNMLAQNKSLLELSIEDNLPKFYRFPVKKYCLILEGLKKNTTLRALNIRGIRIWPSRRLEDDEDINDPIRQNLKKELEHVTGETRIQEDIKDIKKGNAFMTALVQLLQQNQSLTALNLENNGLANGSTRGNLATLLKAFEQNYTLTSIIGISSLPSSIPLREPLLLVLARNQCISSLIAANATTKALSEVHHFIPPHIEVVLGYCELDIERHFCALQMIINNPSLTDTLKRTPEALITATLESHRPSAGQEAMILMDYNRQLRMPLERQPEIVKKISRPTRCSIQ